MGLRLDDRQERTLYSLLAMVREGQITAQNRREVLKVMGPVERRMWDKFGAPRLSFGARIPLPPRRRKE